MTEPENTTKGGSVETVTVPIDALSIVLERAKHHYNQQMWNNNGAGLSDEFIDQIESAFDTLDMAIESADVSSGKVSGIPEETLAFAVERLRFHYNHQMWNDGEMAEETEEQLESTIEIIKEATS
jgi:hypothetical protein